MEKITLKMARAKAKLSQAEIAEKISVSRITYSKYETYEVPMRIDVAVKFCEATHTKLDEVKFF